MLKQLCPWATMRGRSQLTLHLGSFNAGEGGWIVVVKDKSGGYYWVSMFYPANDDTRLYAQTFGEILKSFKFKK